MFTLVLVSDIVINMDDTKNNEEKVKIPLTDDEKKMIDFALLSLMRAISGTVDEDSRRS